MLRRTAMRTGAGLAVVAVAALLLFIGVAFCLWAAYQGLSAQLGPVNAALVIGVLVLFLAGLLIWIAIRLTR